MADRERPGRAEADEANPAANVDGATDGGEGSARPAEDERSFAEESDSLWRLTFGPLIWALHFATSYAATAIVCARFAGPAQPLTELRIALAILTALALSGIAWIAWRSWRRWDFLDDHDYEHAAAIEEDRHEFLGHASFLLALISFIGVLYVAMVPLLLGSCT